MTRRNLAVWSAVFLMCSLCLAGCDSVITVEEARNISRKIYQQLPADQKERLIEDLISASEKGDNTEVKRILNRGVPPDATVRDWNPAIMRAAVNEHLDVIDSLVEFGANVNVQNKQSFTALMTSVINNKRRSVEHLIYKHRANPNIIQHDRGFTALDYAYSSGKEDFIKILTDAGGQTNHFEVKVWQDIRAKNKKRRQQE